jgi:flagellar protein FlaG
MTDELTKSATDVFPVTPHKVQWKDEQATNEITKLNQEFDSNILGGRVAEDLSLKNKQKVLEEKETMTVPQLEKVAEQLQEFIGTMNRGLEFSVDEDSGRDVIKVIDKKSGELIKQYPSEEVLSLVSKLSEATGTFIDSKV